MKGIERVLLSTQPQFENCLICQLVFFPEIWLILTVSKIGLKKQKNNPRVLKCCGETSDCYIKVKNQKSYMRPTWGSNPRPWD